MRSARRTRRPAPAANPGSDGAACTWTMERILALGATTDLATAAAILGISRSAAYKWPPATRSRCPCSGPARTTACRPPRSWEMHLDSPPVPTTGDTDRAGADENGGIRAGTGTPRATVLRRNLARAGRSRRHGSYAVPVLAPATARRRRREAGPERGATPARCHPRPLTGSCRLAGEGAQFCLLGSSPCISSLRSRYPRRRRASSRSGGACRTGSSAKSAVAPATLVLLPSPEAWQFDEQHFGADDQVDEPVGRYPVGPRHDQPAQRGLETSVLPDCGMREEVVHLAHRLNLLCPRIVGRSSSKAGNTDSDAVGPMPWGKSSSGGQRIARVVVTAPPHPAAALSQDQAGWLDQRASLRRRRFGGYVHGRAHRVRGAAG